MQLNMRYTITMDGLDKSIKFYIDITIFSDIGLYSIKSKLSYWVVTHP